MATGGGVACLPASRDLQRLAAEPRLRLTRAARADTSTNTRAVERFTVVGVLATAKIDTAEHFLVDALGEHIAPGAEGSVETTRSSLRGPRRTRSREADGF